MQCNIIIHEVKLAVVMYCSDKLRLIFYNTSQLLACNTYINPDCMQLPARLHMHNYILTYLIKTWMYVASLYFDQKFANF